MSGLSAEEITALEEASLSGGRKAWIAAVAALRDRAVNEALTEAADEVARIHRIGQTPLREVAVDESRDYEAHPLGEPLSHRFGYDTRPAVADWLRARTT